MSTRLGEAWKQSRVREKWRRRGENKTKREMGERMISGGFCWEFLGFTNKGLGDYKNLIDNGEFDGLQAAGLRRTLMENAVQDKIYPMHPKLPKS